MAGLVIRIVDGDTITVQDYSNQTHDIRLTGIDAPEKYQAFGGHSQQNLGNLVNGRDVSVEWKTRDREGRIIGKVMVAPPDSACRHQRECPKTVDAGLEQIKAGQAWWYRNDAKDQTAEDRSSYAQAELFAKLHRYGLWADTNPMPPWEFRHER